MKDEMPNAVSDTVYVLNQLNMMFNVINDKYYDGELDHLEISFKRYSNDSAIHYFPETNEMIIDEEMLASADRISVMMHLLSGAALNYAHKTGIKASSNGGRYLNKNFKDILESHGVFCYRHDRYGFMPKELDPYATKILEQSTWFLAKPIKHIKHIVSKGKKPSSTRKYVCPKCGNSLRATKNLRIICEDCGVRFIKSVEKKPDVLNQMCNDEVPFEEYFKTVFGEEFVYAQ